MLELSRVGWVPFGVIFGCFGTQVDLSAFKMHACTCTLAFKRIDGGQDELPYIAGAQVR